MYSAPESSIIEEGFEHSASKTLYDMETERII